MSKNIFKDAKHHDKVVLSINGKETVQRIVAITAKSIRVSSCNLYKFNRDGKLNKCDNREGTRDIKIRPFIENT